MNVLAKLTALDLRHGDKILLPSGTEVHIVVGIKPPEHPGDSTAVRCMRNFFHYRADDCIMGGELFVYTGTSYLTLLGREECKDTYDVVEFSHLSEVVHERVMESDRLHWIVSHDRSYPKMVGPSETLIYAGHDFRTAKQWFENTMSDSRGGRLQGVKRHVFLYRVEDGNKTTIATYEPDTDKCTPGYEPTFYEYKADGFCHPIYPTHK